MYAVTATVENHEGGSPEWTSIRQVPTFYLHENVQGIVSEEHAREIALEILDAASHPTAVFHVYVHKI